MQVQTRKGMKSYLKGATDKQKFKHYLDKNGPLKPHMPTRCWVWTAGLDKAGYGSGVFECGERKAHRAAYFICTGESAGRQPVCHRCDTPACCRPSHLYKGTQAQNIKEAYDRGLAQKGDNHWTRRQPAKVSAIRKKTWTEKRLQILSNRKHGHAKLDADKVRDIRHLYFEVKGWTQQALADKYGMSIGPINDLLKGRTWSHVI